MAKIWPLFCRWFGYFFALVWKQTLTHLHLKVAVYFAQILKNFAQTMANFSASGMRPHPRHPHAVHLWVHGLGGVFKFCCHGAGADKKLNPRPNSESCAKNFLVAKGFGVSQINTSVQISVGAWGTYPTSVFSRTWSKQYGSLIVHD